MAMERPTIHRCANCDIVFEWEPTWIDATPYCCDGCGQGGPCCCDYDNLPRSARGAPGPAPSPRRHRTMRRWRAPVIHNQSR